MKTIIALLLLVAAARQLPAAAASLYDRAPPGEIVQTANFNFGSTEGGGLYAAVISRVALSSNQQNAHAQYQPYLTIYRQNAGTLAEIYQSPSAADALALVPKRVAVPNVHRLWLPGVDVKIVGAGPLMGPNTQQLVIGVYTFAADCGQVTMHVLRLEPNTQKLHDALQVQNFCKLDGAVSGHDLELTGPYYANKAALCCPTKNNAQATVSFDSLGKRWIISPPYFKLTPESLAAGNVAGEPATHSGQMTATTSTVIHTAAGQRFSISLPSNSSTGYVWQVNNEISTPAIKLLSSKYQPASAKLIGAPGQQIWTYEALLKGYALLGMRYVRPFDTPGVAPAKEAYYVIVIR